jgi:hypothetical protein
MPRSRKTPLIDADRSRRRPADDDQPREQTFKVTIHHYTPADDIPAELVFLAVQDQLGDGRLADFDISYVDAEALEVKS